MASTFHTVFVGIGGFTFESAESRNVTIGDTVIFVFYPARHSIVRAEFGSACVPYEYTGQDKIGFWSGAQVVNDTFHISYFIIQINSTEPIFYYCGIPGFCMRHQMVGVINPNNTQTLEKQIVAAREANFELNPGDPIPPDSTSSLRLFATPSPTRTTSSSASRGKNLKQLKTYLPLGIVCLLILVLLAGYTVWKHKKKAQASDEDMFGDEEPWQKPEMDGVDTRHETDSQPVGIELDAGLTAELNGCESAPQLLENTRVVPELDNSAAIYEVGSDSVKRASEDLPVV